MAPSSSSRASPPPQVSEELWHEPPIPLSRAVCCWLAALDLGKNSDEQRFDARKPMLWGFLIPVAVMLLFNIGVLLYFAHTTCTPDASLNSSQVSTLRKKMLSCMSLAIVLGLSWTISYFLLISNGPGVTHTILNYVFCLCNTTQGVQIFILFTVRTKVFKERFTALLKSIPVPEVALHRVSFQLWSIRGKDLPESYRSTAFDQLDEQALTHTDNGTENPP
ncbi:hypothetical protein NFI96_003968 [Prochilodus magdalenae]|nr:hypothetical protein NFI96_003968 [Prochilodus magdalenae]